MGNINTPKIIKGRKYRVSDKDDEKKNVDKVYCYSKTIYLFL